MTGKYLSLLVLVIVIAAKYLYSTPELRRSDFPKDFTFGSSTSAYQIEGAAHEDGKGPSIWDTFTEKHPERIKDGSNGSVAADSYHLYKEDVAIMHEIGLNAYRFSISWSRILPHGNLKGGINQAGIDYYNNLINELLSKGITPFATIYHWDTPQGIEDAYGGLLGAEFVNDFRNYADICFKNFGDRVKHWVTMNEPLSVVQGGYGQGKTAPGRCSKFTNPKCTAGDGATEPYIVGHNLILSHGAAVEVYREKYNASQKGQVGIALNTPWYLPYSEESAEDKLAVARVMAFTIDFFMEPLVTGKYPLDMVNNVGGRLPTFSEQQSKMLKGSYDFIGINYYSSSYAKDAPCSTEQAASDWLLIYPKGIRGLVLYVKYKFKDPVIYITENGRDESNTPEKFPKNPLNDNDRIDYYTQHLEMLKDAISIGAQVKGFFVWSLLDNFEWSTGYTVRFGLVYVDFNDGCKRTWKKSAYWFKKFLKSKKSN
ncbi:hypothetical protein Bca4012_035130 [Brassica carinata]